MRRWTRLVIAILTLVTAGCGVLRPANRSYSRAPAVDVRVPKDHATLLPPSAAAPIMETDSSDLFASKRQLALDDLVTQVLARNPSLVQMVAAWQAAQARVGQVTSLDDPMLAASFGPGSFGSNNVEFAYRLELAQKLPFPGKLGLRGQAARAEAGAAGSDVDDMRLMLIEAAKHAFYEFYLVERALEVNGERRKRLTEMRQNALARAKIAAHQQEVLQADLEIAAQGERQLELEQMRRVVIARINTLLHLPPDAPVPSPPSLLTVGALLPDVQALRQTAVAGRPDLHALAERIAAEEAALRLAQKEYYPDFEVMAAYDAFWQGQDRDLRTQVGLKMNLPVLRARRHAAVAEAQARLGQRRAELERRRDQIQFEVQEAFEKVKKSEQVVRLFAKTILPAAEANVKEAISAYTTGKIPFVTLVDAQNKLVNLRDRYYEAVAEYFRRLATLERMVGQPIGSVHK